MVKREIVVILCGESKGCESQNAVLAKLEQRRISVLVKLAGTPAAKKVWDQTGLPAPEQQGFLLGVLDEDNNLDWFEVEPNPELVNDAILVREADHYRGPRRVVSQPVAQAAQA